MRLRSYDSSPPGGFPYAQPAPKPRNFPAQPLIEAQARIVLEYRKANGLAHATYAECIVDIDRYTCHRLGDNPLFCVACPTDSTEISFAANAPGLVPCAGCGAKV